MGKLENKTEITDRIPAIGPDGEPITVIETTSFIREQLHDMSWTPWLRTTCRYSWGQLHLNPAEDGSWETAEHAPRKVTRRH